MKKTIKKDVWTLLWVGWVAIALSQVLTFGYGMIVPGIMESFGIDYATIGMVGSVAGWVAVVANIPIAGLAAKSNPKYALPVIYGLFGLGCILFATAQSIAMLYIGRIIAGVAGAGLVSALVVIKIRHVPAERIAEINGIENFVQPIGQTCATLFMAQLLALLSGWRGIYIAISCLMVVSAILWIVVFNKVNRGEVAPDAAETNKGTAAPAPAEEESVLVALKQALSKPTVILYALAYPGTIIIWIGFFYYYPSYFMEVRGFTAAQAGLATGLFPVFSALASIITPKIAMKYDLNKSILVGHAILLCIGYYVMLKIQSLALICVISAVTGFISYTAVPIYFTNVYMLGLPPKAVQMATSVLMTMVSFGSAIGATVIGVSVNTSGLYSGLALCCLTPLWYSLLTALTPSYSKKAMAKRASQNK